MITSKMKVEQFKRECKSVQYYNMIIEKYDNRIRTLDELLDNLENKNTGNTKNLLLEQEELLIERKDFENRRNEVWNKISKIDEKNDQQMLIDAFINRIYYKKLIHKYHFNDSSALYRHINSVIEKLI